MSQEIKIPAQPVTPERLERIKAIPSELMSAAIALVCSSERYDLNRDLNYAQLAAGQAIIDLVAEVEGLTASRNYGRDIINDMTLEAYDFKASILAELKEAWGQGDWANIQNLIQSLQAEDGASPALPSTH